MLSPAVDNLVAQLTRLPGIGTRTAQRLAFHILAAPADEANAIGSAIAEVKARVRPCRECGNLTEEALCGVCSDSRRDRTVICVVEQPVDVLSLERTHEYRGLYHVLGGALSPLDGVEPGDLRIERLLDRVGADGVEEVVLATNPTMTGEATAAYLADRLRDRVSVTRLASGLPVGGDLEYADEVTLGRALADVGRREARRDTAASARTRPHERAREDRRRRRDRRGRHGDTWAPRRARLWRRARFRVRPIRRYAGPVRRRRARRRGGHARSAWRRRRRPVPLLGRHVREPRARSHRLRGRGDVCRQVVGVSLVDGYPLVVPEVNGERAPESLDRDRIVANPNCCAIPLACVLHPLHEAAGLAQVRVSTYQSVSGAGAQRMTALAGERPEDHDLAMDWTWEGDESDEEAKLRAETRKILELPELPVSATCVRVPVMVGHSEAVWVELEQPIEPDEAAARPPRGTERPRARSAGVPDTGRGGRCR